MKEVRVYGIPSSDPRGGLPGFIATLTMAGVAAGCDALFIETHPRTEDALCDSASMLRLDLLPVLLDQAVAFHDIVRKKA
jgi:2-dehydro-3-deoxyphosphooctonate aldolase (KDO 8-P synthase)